MSRCLASALEECNFLMSIDKLTEKLMKEVADHHSVDFNKLKECYEERKYKK